MRIEGDDFSGEQWVTPPGKACKSYVSLLRESVNLNRIAQT